MSLFVRRFVLSSIYSLTNSGKHYLYVQADVLCYTHWKWLLIGFCGLWIIPYCATLHYASVLMTSCRITPTNFLVVLFFPPSLVYYSVRNRFSRSKAEANSGANLLSETDAMTGKHILMDLYDAFKVDESNKYMMWEPVLIFRKLSIVFATTFVVHPIVKLYVVVALLTIFLCHHTYVQPYGMNNFLFFLTKTCDKPGVTHRYLAITLDRGKLEPEITLQ